MIYLELVHGEKLLVLEPGNLKHLQEGGTVLSPDKRVALIFTPDALWLGEEIASAAKADVLTRELLVTLHTDSMKREPVVSLPSHPMNQIIKDGKPV